MGGRWVLGRLFSRASARQQGGDGPRSSADSRFLAFVTASGEVQRVAANPGPLRALVAALERTPGLPVFADLSDNYASLAAVLGNAFLAEYQESLASHCGLIVPCAELERQLAPYARRGIRVIEDPYESAPAQHARMRPGEGLRLFWFGNLGKPNFGLLECGRAEVGEGMATRARSIELALVC